ncbi:MAG: iron ABC transporter permease [Syntrophus sp. (in: bacteria)]|nr:iron ABC transporter permease [Syntrophus sp. (in: bacteria)]
MESAVTLKKVLRTSLLLLAGLLAVSAVSLLCGPAETGMLSKIREGLTGGHLPAFVLTPEEKTILFSLRLPRIVFAGLVGASLSTAGVLFQALLRNPLADPYILGISGGSALGAIVGIFAGLGSLPLGIPVPAFLGAAVTVFLVLAAGGSKRGFSSGTLLLAGVIVNAFFSALIMLSLALSSHADLQKITFWLMGNLSLAGYSEAMLTALVLTAGFAVAVLNARSINLMSLGEETALHLGVSVGRIRILLLLSGSLLTSVAVAFSGTIGFVGLIIPHLMRMLLGADHRLLLPASLLFGASFLIAADTLARTLVPDMDLPVGVVTALCGSPYFLYLLRKGRFSSWSS